MCVCDKVMCDKVVCEQIVCEQVVLERVVCVRELCVTKLRVKIVCDKDVCKELCVWRRLWTAGVHNRKSRTPHNDVGEKQFCASPAAYTFVIQHRCIVNCS